MQQIESLQKSPTSLNFSPKAYGDVWASPAQILNEISTEQKTEAEKFKEALSKGYFSQYTSYQQRQLIEQIVNWQIKILSKWLGPDLSCMPSSLNELEIVPDVLLVEYDGQIISPDLLRNLWYVLFLYHQQSLSSVPLMNILEIGSGYGSFARILKSYYPSACVWLVDLPESLIYAETYLKAAYPKATIAVINSSEKTIYDTAAYDFVLVSVHESEKLMGRQFDLAANIWSFGEMPNAWIGHWFNLLQTQCTIDRLYVLNAFTSPVTPCTEDRIKQGDWLFALNNAWNVKSFEIDPEIHRCPLVRNFYTGLGIYCEQLKSQEETTILKRAASHAVQKVLHEDWVTIILGDKAITNLSRPETNIHAPAFSPQILKQPSISVQKLLVITEYIGHPRFESGCESTLYWLFNDFRLNSNPLSGQLLLVYFAMINKSALSHRVSKEEIFLLKRLPACLLHEEYEKFFSSNLKEIQIDYQDSKYSIQKACDLAGRYYKEGRLDMAKQLAARVAIAMPEHADCWHQLALIAEAEKQIILAVVMSTHASRLAPSYEAYINTKDRLLKRLQRKPSLQKILFNISAKASDSDRDKMVKRVQYFLPFKQHENIFSIIVAGYLTASEPNKYLNRIAGMIQIKNSDVISEAFNTAISVKKSALV